MEEAPPALRQRPGPRTCPPITLAAIYNRIMCRRSHKRGVRLATALLAAAISVCASAQITPCTFANGEPTCNSAAFKQSLAAARTVSFNESDLNPYFAKQLAELLTSLGKQIIPFADHPDLTFALTFPSTEGVFVGPAGVVLARLRVYGPGARTPLVWEETYMDQPDVPLQAAVLYLLKQFHEGFPGK